MTRVTDEMVEAAQQASRRDGFGIMPHSEVRAALEAALEVLREPTGDAGELVSRLRLWITRRDNVSLGWVEEAADLLEWQAEEIADNEAFVSILQKEVQRLTAERAKLIERQAEEIAALSHTVKEAGLTNLQLTAERMELYDEIAEYNKAITANETQINKLIAERNELKHDIERHLQHISGYETERAELIAALRPFTQWEELPPLNGYPSTWHIWGYITLGHLRRARALLERLGAVIRD